MDSTSGFADTYQRSPEVVWSAPGRANLIGEHTDYNDGFVLPFAIAERTEVAAARRGDETIMVTSRGGRHLTASHRSMRDDYEITTPALDLAVEAALSAGALGARMTGGGFGGSTITLIDARRLPALRAAIEDAFAAARLAAPRRASAS
jgi:galactokinase